MGHPIITGVLISIFLITGIFSYVFVYWRGIEQGRKEQLKEDRSDLEDAAVKAARSEQLAEVWAKRARALLLLQSREEK